MIKAKTDNVPWIWNENLVILVATLLFAVIVLLTNNYKIFLTRKQIKLKQFEFKMICIL